MTTSAEALEGAALAQGRTTRLSTILVDPDNRLLQKPDPWTIPDELDAGFDISGTISADVRVAFHADARARSVWLVIDEENAPLTGTYTVVIDAQTCTFSASSETDVEAVLNGIRDAINGSTADVTATVVAVKATGVLDAVRVVSDDSPANTDEGVPQGKTNTSFQIVGSTTTFPAGAALHIMREITSASLRLWCKRGHETSSAVDTDLTDHPLGLLQDAWVVPNNGDVGALAWGGYAERLQMAAQSALWVQVYTIVDPDDDLPGNLTDSGAGIYGITDLVYVAVAPAVTS